MAGGKRWATIGGCGTVVAVVAFLWSIQYRGVGGFDQRVIVHAAKPVKAVHWCAENIDVPTRLRAEQAADPLMFNFKEAARSGNGDFTASITCTTSDGPLRPSRVYHYPHLIVMVEFADGERAIRVVDIPPGLGKGPILVRFD